MDKPISVGDLVQVVRGHSCLMEVRLGAIFVVDGFTPALNGGWTCGRCGERDIASHDAYGATGLGAAPVKVDLPFAHLTNGRKSIPVSWLKRIPPIEELDDVTRDEEITA